VTTTADYPRRPVIKIQSRLDIADVGRDRPQARPCDCRSIRLRLYAVASAHVRRRAWEV